MIFANRRIYLNELKPEPCLIRIMISSLQLMKKASASKVLSNASPAEHLRLALQQASSLTLLPWINLFSD